MGNVLLMVDHGRCGGCGGDEVNKQNQARSVIPGGSKMSKTTRTRFARGTFALLLGMALATPAISHAAGVEAIESTWGKPAIVEKGQGDSEIRYYELGSLISDGYRVFEVRKDGTVIDKGVSRGTSKGAGHNQSVAGP